ncbi:MAG: PspC domain-containing protein, partial [Geodermatophilales bacterium]|nr:PspC domain-containing protein [Geodermatophilales bacterium]
MVPPGPAQARPPLVRPRTGRVIGGVAAGTAAHLRQDPLIVRVAFVVLSTAFIGIVA